MDRVKVYIQSSLIPLTEVKPVISGDFEFSKEKNRIYHKHEAKDAFKFDKKADWLLLQPQITDECGEVTITVEKLCKGNYSLYWTGVFSIFDATIDYDRCFIEVKPEVLDDYKCFEDGLKDEQNIFSSGAITTAFGVGGVYETSTCFGPFSQWRQNIEGNNGVPPPTVVTPNPIDTCLNGVTEWCVSSNTINVTSEYYDPTNGWTIEYEQTTIWHRELSTTDCVGGVPQPPAIGTGWAILDDNCSSNNTATWWRCPSSGIIAGDYTRGRTFENVVNRILTNLSCSLTVKSDFFNINPLGDAPTNPAYTYAANNLQHLTVHQQSDVKRKNATSGSSAAAWDIKGEDFFEDLRKIFNVWYVIENGVLILEHYSFFTTNLGWDLSNKATPRKIDYSGNENVRTEKFYWKEENSSYAFRSQTIMYDCGEEDKDVRCKMFNADIVYIETEANADKINDDGFVLVANEFSNNKHVIINNNDPLKWTSLQAALHPYARLYKSGKINNVQQNFISWLPYIKQEKFKVDYCCDQQFNPQDLITTSLGNGVVDSATHNVLTDRLELELSY